MVTFIIVVPSENTSEWLPSNLRLVKLDPSITIRTYEPKLWIAAWISISFANAYLRKLFPDMANLIE